MAPRLDALGMAAFELYSSARDAGEFDVAYHALCAALHAAERAGDATTCEVIGQRANECRDWLDLHEPGHRLSTQSAQSRGHESIFRQLAVMAESAGLRMQSDEHKRKGRP